MVELSTCLDSIKQTVKTAIPDMVNLVSHLALPAIRELCVMKGSARLTENVIRLGKWKNKAENASTRKLFRKRRDRRLSGLPQVLIYFPLTQINCSTERKWSKWNGK